jgi:hypothetical protein
LTKQGRLAQSLPSLAALILCVGLPAAIWMIWCKTFYGDFTGSAIKAKSFGWTVKPFAEWWHHPIFTPHGFWIYFAGQMGTFWQGEMWWDNVPLALPGTNGIYSILSLVLLGAGLPALVPKYSNFTPARRMAFQWSFACFAAMLAFFAFMSIIYDFHDGANPTREHPYFHAGRMLLGALIPFLLLIVYGLDRLLDRFGGIAKFLTLGLMLSGMLILEIATDYPVFSNAYNWFHLF